MYCPNCEGITLEFLSYDYKLIEGESGEYIETYHCPYCDVEVVVSHSCVIRERKEEVFDASK